MPTNSNFYFQNDIKVTDNPFKKILANARGFLPQVEVKFLHNRNKFSIDRNGVTAFAFSFVFFLEDTLQGLFLPLDLPSPPAKLDFQKIRLE